MIAVLGEIEALLVSCPLPYRSFDYDVIQALPLEHSEELLGLLSLWIEPCRDRLRSLTYDAIHSVLDGACAGFWQRTHAVADAARDVAQYAVEDARRLAEACEVTHLIEQFSLLDTDRVRAEQRVQSSEAARVALESGMNSYRDFALDFIHSRTEFQSHCVTIVQSLCAATEHLDYISQQLALWRIIFEI